MEKVYGCGDLDYTSEPICLRNFFNDASVQNIPFAASSVELKGSKVHQNDARREQLMDVMDTALTDSEFVDLENICSADNFKVPEQSGIEQQLSIFTKVECPSDSDLETHRKLNSRSRIQEKYLKYTSVVWLDRNNYSQSSGKSKRIQDVTMVPGSDIVAVVRLYAPFCHEVGKRSHRIAAGCQELIILGSQTLADLRDVFTCGADDIICQDLSSNPFRQSKVYAKDKYKSGMMYLGGTFYDDQRNVSNIEYSKTVLEWAKEQNLRLGKKAKMEDTKIIDLTVRLGYPYLYQHQGNCEHLFCFSDIRLLHQSDSLKLSHYPALISKFKQQSRHCMMCGQFIAKWVTVGNKRAPHDPCYFCETCFVSYNYINKQKIGQFFAYPFSDSANDFIAKPK